jgi:hypothetical protein
MLALRLRFEHPRLADLPCSECQKWVYEIPSGEPQTYEIGNGEVMQIERRESPPCHLCPKESPEREHLYQLSDRNHRLLMFHRRVRSKVYQLTGEQRRDGLLADNFAIIDDVMAVADQKANRDRLAHSIANALAMVLGR